MSQPDGHLDIPDTEPPPPLPDGEVECLCCGTTMEEDRAYAEGWRTVTQIDDEDPRWQCVRCARHDVDL